ncbi:MULTISPECIES: cytochrome c family protein [unclassified Mesorhizobium]|uniref:c-type cytochrome n=1 Tax=unclassified Mesorhizobium TaxID=325217 RepID=UPI0009620442|nr:MULTISPECIES: cytochrome c family protein [unclassified Mesorhizobium]MBN9254942.1 cytochrome c family protein [Mesorhizobium sp.]MBN9275299.1 cytochrome c family protein [Mesorhizobium sp.]OJX71945.1 MAG: cytochrome c family protein [Mesorhizobium sp. 65-26]
MRKISSAIIPLSLLCAGTAFAAGDPAAGQASFKVCQACHAIGPGAVNKVGPVLNGVVGRAAGSAEGFNYSAAMKSSGLTWDEATLTKYLTSPRDVVKGNKMAFAGLKKPEDVANVIAYLNSFNADGSKK